MQLSESPMGRLGTASNVFLKGIALAMVLFGAPLAYNHTVDPKERVFPLQAFASGVRDGGQKARLAARTAGGPPPNATFTEYTASILLMPSVLVRARNHDINGTMLSNLTSRAIPLMSSNVKWWKATERKQIAMMSSQAILCGSLMSFARKRYSACLFSIMLVGGLTVFAWFCVTEGFKLTPQFGLVGAVAALQTVRNVRLLMSEDPEPDGVWFVPKGNATATGNSAQAPPEPQASRNEKRAAAAAKAKESKKKK